VASFTVTYEIVTPDSAHDGDADERGFVVEHASLRHAIDAVNATRTNRVDGVTAIEWNGNDRRWITIDNGFEFETGAQESRSLHIPEQVSNASRNRIGRLLGAHPLR
jgi:hypothetical protein